MTQRFTKRNRAPNSILGVDEVGRGCLAGPVVVCAYRARKYLDLTLKDSKAYPAKKREQLNELLLVAGDFVLIEKDHRVVDKINILQASLLAMAEAIEKIAKKNDEIIIDGNQLPPVMYFNSTPPVNMRAQIKADADVYEVSAASIIAKVYRDRLMVDFDKIYPGYFFASNKGYGSKAHLQAYKEKGPCKIHRLTFKPIVLQI